MSPNPIHLSSRIDLSPPNAVATAKAEALSDGRALIDLSDSNPTRHGLTDPLLFDVLAAHLGRAAQYLPDPKGWLPARQALADRFGGTPNQYWLTASTSEAYSWLFAALCDVGDSVATPVPGYPLIDPLARLSGVATVPYRAYYSHPSGWEFDLNSVAAALATPGVRALVAVNPNNPTGAYLTPEVGLAIGEACARAGAVLIADEVFFEFDLEAEPGQRAPLPNSAGDEAIVVTFGGLSKLLAAPQLKLAWMRVSGPSPATEPLGQALDAIADTYLSVNSPVAVALPDLLELAESTVERVTRRCRGNLGLLAQLDDGFRLRRTQGGWTGLLDVPPMMDDDELAHWMGRHGLSAHPGWFYDLPDEGVIAVSLLPEPTLLSEAIDQLRGLATYRLD